MLLTRGAGSEISFFFLSSISDSVDEELSGVEDEGVLSLLVDVELLSSAVKLSPLEVELSDGFSSAVEFVISSLGFSSF